jgi:hypothetical protein
METKVTRSSTEEISSGPVIVRVTDGDVAWWQITVRERSVFGGDLKSLMELEDAIRAVRETLVAV